jgi:hypothetical protein
MGMPRDAPDFVADAVHERLPKIRLQGTVVPWLERIDVPQGLRERFLYEILGVAQIARPLGQTPARPPA